MMNSRCLRLIEITILINCVYTGRLTIQENEERIANCGKKQLTSENFEKFASGKDGTHFIMPSATYLVRVLTLDHQENLASGFFISPRHILTSSQSVFNEKRQWLNDTNDQITEKMCTTPKEVPPVYANQIRVIFDDSWKCFEKTPCHLGKIKNATLLSLCRPIDAKDAKDKEFKIFFSPMLIELETNHKNIKFPCLADSSTELKPGDVVHAHRWQWYIENGKNLSRPQYLKRTIDSVEDEFIATGQKQYIEKVRGGLLVMHETPKGTLAIGIDATSE
ncbi:hypothetical protein CAEBREN_23192 [Caenorhabditis brenneri]|uniref:Peptidase S1 domain-containing protein n=1 Tax=Caenorhabditis brenneri TaxID=135651 RepID=G0NVD7_CAEBE|nr:hypothetical protein CAEBREN_23192 [Caenorhabditis brenneri]